MPENKPVLRSPRRAKVLCGGVFNHVHEGHECFLRGAKKPGSELVVVIANDTHNKKPYAKPQDERMSAVKKLGIADRVIAGNPGSFVETVRKEKPDIIALGYDQKLPEDCEDYVKQNSIRVARMQRHGRHRTSEILG